MAKRPLTKAHDYPHQQGAGFVSRLGRWGILLVGLGLSGPIRAMTLGYSGRVTDAGGAPLSGPVDIKVRFYGTLSENDELSSPLSFGQVALQDGIFQLQINLTGTQNVQIFGDGTKQVFIEIEAAGIIYPRQRFLSVPFALRVPVDQSTLAYGSDGNLTVDQVPMDRVTGLITALSAKANTPDLSTKAPLVHTHGISDITGLTAALAGKADVGSTSSSLSLPLAVSQGGTGGTTAATARTGLGAAASGVNSDITSLTGLSTALSVTQGGTGATTLPANNVLVGNGTSSPVGIAPGTSGNVLLSNGTIWTSGVIPWAAPGNIGSTTPGSGAFTTLSTNGSGGLELNPYSLTAGSTGEIRFKALTGTNHVGFKAPDTIMTPKIWSLPASDGTSGQALTTNGGGTLSWSTFPSTSGSLTWSTVTGTSQNADVNSGYITNNPSRVSVNLPSTCVLGDRISIVGLGAGGWALTSGIGLVGPLGSPLTSPLNSVKAGQIAEAFCLVANTTWKITFPGGPAGPSLSLAAYTGYTEQLYQATLVGLSASQTEVTYFCTICPTGMTLNPVTGALSWTPTSDLAGIHRFTFGASDSQGFTSLTVTFTVFYQNGTGIDENFVVPPGVTSVSIKAWGAGGGGSAYAGGAGAYGEISSLATTPGETLSIKVGYSGGAAAKNSTIGQYLAGYGGGLTSVFRSTTPLLVVAGGGGGGYYGEGGAGGVSAGAAGSGASAGGGASTSAGGIGGTGSTTNGGAGGYLSGGSISYMCWNGGGGGGGSSLSGGGGYYGGGVGGLNATTSFQNPPYCYMGAGGGGSSYAAGGTLTAGSGTTPGNSGDSMRGTAGDGGAVDSAGGSGRLLISW